MDEKQEARKEVLKAVGAALCALNNPELPESEKSEVREDLRDILEECRSSLLLTEDEIKNLLEEAGM